MFLIIYELNYYFWIFQIWWLRSSFLNKKALKKSFCLDYLMRQNIINIYCCIILYNDLQIKNSPRIKIDLLLLLLPWGGPKSLKLPYSRMHLNTISFALVGKAKNCSIKERESVCVCPPNPNWHAWTLVTEIDPSENRPTKRERERGRACSKP